MPKKKGSVPDLRQSRLEAFSSPSMMFPCNQPMMAAQAPQQQQNMMCQGGQMMYPGNNMMGQGYAFPMMMMAPGCYQQGCQMPGQAANYPAAAMPCSQPMQAQYTPGAPVVAAPPVQTRHSSRSRSPARIASPGGDREISTTYTSLGMSWA